MLNYECSKNSIKNLKNCLNKKKNSNKLKLNFQMKKMLERPSFK